jgi:hypothetical protein
LDQTDPDFLFGWMARLSPGMCPPLKHRLNLRRGKLCHYITDDVIKCNSSERLCTHIHKILKGLYPYCIDETCCNRLTYVIVKNAMCFFFNSPSGIVALWITPILSPHRFMGFETGMPKQCNMYQIKIASSTAECIATNLAV